MVSTPRQINEKNIWLAGILNLIIALLQTLGGFFSNSLSLLSDSLHNLSDSLAIFLSLFAYKFSKKKRNSKQTFGYKRAQILAAIINSSVLFAVSIFLIAEAIKGLINPRQINGFLMIAVAFLGTIINFLGVFLLKTDSKHNLNVKSAYLHLLSDALSSVAVIAGGLLIYFMKIMWVDSALTILICAYVIKESYKIIAESINILMQSTPPGLEVNEVKALIESCQEVKNAHHIHIWRLDDKDIHLECHIELCKDHIVSKADLLRKDIEKKLIDQFGISHITIQMEYDSQCLIEDRIFIPNANCG